MNRIMIAGIGTEVGKTVISAIMTTLLQGNYWKPIQCGDEESSDTMVMKRLIDLSQHHIYSPAYSLQAPLSPHHAAHIENRSIDVNSIIPPQTTAPLIIETVGGIYAPLTTSCTSLDLFSSWESKWVLVSRHYLGSINHTLLTIEVLKNRGIPLAGIIFNGDPNPESESAILKISQLPFIARVLPEPYLNFKTIQRYAKKWRPQLQHILA